MTDAAKLQAAEARIAELERERDRARLDHECSEGVLSMTVARLAGFVDGQPTHRGDFLQRIDELREVEANRDALRARLAAMERRAEEWQLRATFGSIEDEDDLSLHDRQVHDALLRQRDLARHQLAAAAEEAARLRKALDLAGRKISGAALHQMHEHAEAEVREALRSMSDTLNATPSTGEAVREAVRALGAWCDAKPAHRTRTGPDAQALIAALRLLRERGLA